MVAISHLADYCSTNPEAVMQLEIHSDVSYPSEPKAKSRIGGYVDLENKTGSSETPSQMAHSFDMHQ
jgi:hypothetical protein